MSVTDNIKNKMNNKKLFLYGVKSALPIVAGFVPVGMAFGMLAISSGISLLPGQLLSTIVFAGASQFMAVNLLASGFGIWQIIAATFLMNLRHMLMSSNLALRTNLSKKWIPVIAFGVTDETFSIMALDSGELKAPYMFGLNLTAWSAWNLGTLTGMLFGSILPVNLQQAMGLGLYALFVAILIPEIKKAMPALVTALVAGGLHIIFKLIPFFKGWELVLSIGIGAFAASVIMSKGDRKNG